MNAKITIEVDLMETNFFNLGTKKQISREEMLAVLKELNDIKIKASYPIAVSEIDIENMRLQHTDRDTVGAGLLSCRGEEVLLLVTSGIGHPQTRHRSANGASVTAIATRSSGACLMATRPSPHPPQL